MRRYETIIITDPDLAEDGRKALTAKVGELMAAEGGHLVKQDDWGVRKLAYEIRKKPRGYYTLFDFCGGGALVDEMERQFRIDDRVLKYMTVLLDKEADLDAIKAELAAAEAEASGDSTDQPVAETKTEAKAEPAPEGDGEAQPTEPAENAETESVDKE